MSRVFAALSARTFLRRWIIVAGVVGLLSKTVYRHLIVSQNVNDLGLHGILPTFCFALLTVLVLSLWLSPLSASLAAVAGGVAWELDQLRTDGFEDVYVSSAGRTFDPWDLVAVGVGAALGYACLKYEERTQKKTANCDKRPAP